VEISDNLKEIIINYFQGELTQSQADELLAWIGRHEENLNLLRKLEEIWEATGSLSQISIDENRAIKAISSKITERGLRRLPAKTLSLRTSVFYRWAASILIIMALGISGLFLTRNRGAKEVVSFVETSAPKGSRSLITLSDGTTVWLNADTKLRYPTDYGINGRTVYLEGEAYFKVSTNKRLPFRVNTSEVTITALGTAFNVKAYNEENTIETTLEQGQVRIEGVKSVKGKDKVTPVTLQPKQNAVFRKHTNQIAVTGTEDTEMKISTESENKVIAGSIKVKDLSDTRPYTSWKDQRWIIKNEKLAELAPKLERRYDVKILFMDKGLEEQAFNGTLLEESLEQVLAAIRYSAPIRYEIDAKEVRLYEDKELIEQYKKLLNP